MNWSYRIKAARENQKLTREQLVERMKLFTPDGKTISARTLIAWECGDTEPKVTQAIALARALGYQEVSALFEPSIVHQLNDIGLSRLEEYRQLLLASPRFCDSIYKNTRLLPVYLQAASAGLGQWLDDDASEQVEVGEDVPASAQFGVRLAGDSMEPRFANGQIVWAKRAQDAENGSIVLCWLNGQSYCKKLHHADGAVQLISLNQNYAPIAVNASDEFRIFGVVVG